MAGAKEIRIKIGSIKNTQKITSAMEMVAASKMRRAQERMGASRPYAQRILRVINHVAQAQLEYRHPYLLDRPVKRVAYLVVSSDRGLCGGLNINLFKKLAAEIKAQQQLGIEADLYLIGGKAVSFFSRVGGKVIAKVSGLGDAPQLKDLLGLVHAQLASFDEGKVDRVYLVYNSFVNTMTQAPTVQQLLPLPETDDKDELGHHWDYIYEPDSKFLLDLLLRRYIESQTYQGVVENLACEQAARMVAMKNATDNAGGLIKELQLVYNKARQASITQELTEIVAGAAAV